METVTIEAIRAANRELATFLVQISSPQPFAHPQGPLPDLQPVADALDRVTVSLHSLPKDRKAESLASQPEVLEYRANLERLQDLLPGLQSQLGDRRRALATHLGKIQGALNWVASFSQTRW